MAMFDNNIWYMLIYSTAYYTFIYLSWLYISTALCRAGVSVLFCLGWFSLLKEVNENSLKRLNGYLENLQKPGARDPKPANFTFYVRDTKERADSSDSLLASGNTSSPLIHTVIFK